MKTVIHKAGQRGKADYGWLQANYSFSFSNWFDPNRMGFGALRVLNNDRVAPGAGFPTHPHDNMEIITIPLSGALEHKDSMGNTAQIKTGEVQVMSAGTGITHSEYNASKTEELTLFQLWIIPNKKNVKPRYEELQLDVDRRLNTLQQIVSPSRDDEGLWIHQNAWLFLSKLESGNELDYKGQKEGNGVYLMVISGEVEVEGERLANKDAMGITEAQRFAVRSESEAELLFIEVPMN